jgi:thymidylate synthase ThyX
MSVPKTLLTDEQAIQMVMDASQNPLWGESLNLSTHSKLMRTLQHVHFTFRKKLSHTADSQDQRHRMTPGSRPIISAHITEIPDYITPSIIKAESTLEKFYDETMKKCWEGIQALLKLGIKEEYVEYLLPNAVSIRFTESADLLNLHHKMKMRLCYNAQEEIWRAAVEEADQIQEKLPLIGKYLQPPCVHRQRARKRPFCPEGSRYCGVPVWKLERKEYKRLI